LPSSRLAPGQQLSQTEEPMNPSPPRPIHQSVPWSAADGRFLPNRVPVESRLLVSVAYDHDQLVLQLELRDGSLYQFFQVPCQTHQELLQADSKGAYFNRHVRNRF